VVPVNGRTPILERAVRNCSDLETYLEMYCVDVVLHGYGPAAIGKADPRGFCGEMMVSFPGWQVHLDDVIETDDRLVIRYTQTGRHDGEFMGIPAADARSHRWASASIDTRATTWSSGTP
jgi:hypothetical protein